ncbi:hypothetical protein SpCBS45565_g04759 [Spizellomyces sp. 'palustris']|nr:hypothetical protein SpCBS45565_g04759 [Spizellomyces sp. 'palustris']
MSFLFKTRPRTPAELVKGTKDSVQKLDVGDRKKTVDPTLSGFDVETDYTPCLDTG